MASITQSIPNYTGGISEQPDERKFPGQVIDCINAIPDATYGLYKRPGSKRIGSTPLTSVAAGGSWFHYYRDETEGSYIGQVQTDGTLNVWRCSDGQKMNTVYGTGGESAIKTYLSASNTEDVQFLTINDTTFVNNRDTPVLTTGTTDAASDTHYAYLEILRTENGRQYALNAYNTETTTTLKRATRLRIESDTLYEGGGSGTCPGIGTQVFSVSDSDYTLSTLTDARINTSDGGGVTNGKVTVYYNGHGFKTGDQVYIEEVGDTCGANFDNQTKAVITRNDDNSFYYIADSNQGDLDNGAGANQHSVKIRTAHELKKNLIFRVTSLGQQGQINDYGDNDSKVDSNAFACSYNRQVQLLHGGEDWQVGDQVVVTLTQAKTNYDYTIYVEDAESISTKADIKAVRPAPTPFDADTAVTIDTIIGGITGELAGTGITTTVIGNGIYMTKSSAFQIEIQNKDLMRVMQSTVNDVSLLPSQCKDGYLVKVSNSQESEDDDYHLKFVGENNKDGPGSWEEVAAPGIIKGFDLSTMPHVIQRTATDTFTVKQFSYPDRTVGDDNTNSIPSFVSIRSGHPDYDGSNEDRYINKVLFFRNRLAFLSGENVITCQPGTLGKPNFWAKTAIAVSTSDPIDISSSSMFPSDLYDGIDINAGLLVFSSNQQFLLSSDDTILNPDTAKFKSVSTYNYNVDIPPISMGVSVGYVDNSGKYSRFNEMINTSREGEPVVGETSKIVPSLLPKDIDLVTNSRENQLVLFGKTNSDIVYGFKYFQLGDKRQQASWFKWKFNNPIKYHFIIDDDYYFLDTDDFLQKMSIVQSDNDASIDQDGVNYLLHLDNWTTVANGTYNANTNLTTFENQSDWIDQVTTPNGALVLVDSNANSTRVGRYAECTVINTDDFTVPGDWSGSTLNIGYLYEYNVQLPTIYSTKTEGTRTIADVNASLIIHRINLSFGKIGLYETTLSRVDKGDYTEVHEAASLNEYNLSDAPYVVEKVKTIPVYEKNKNVDITLKSSHPAPATLHSVSWEGDYSPMFYQRV